MNPEKGFRTPQSGEALILVDGRRYRIAAAENGVRGWWFSATAHDGQSTLQGNMRLAWDPDARVWRPLGARNNGTSPRLVWQSSLTRHKVAN